jgi:hypothetical protein
MNIISSDNLHCFFTENVLCDGRQHSHHTYSEYAMTSGPLVSCFAVKEGAGNTPACRMLHQTNTFSAGQSFVS